MTATRLSRACATKSRRCSRRDRCRLAAATCRSGNSMRARLLRWLLLAVLIIGPAAAGQEPPQPTFRTEANYVRVDVYPTSNGAPVTDLQKDDFEILEEGAPQTID